MNDWEPRPAIYPAEWLDEVLEENAPMASQELEDRKAYWTSVFYKCPYTIEEIKKMFPGLYFPVEH